MAALVPLVIGFIWYNPKVFGNSWKNVAEINDDKMKGANMPLVFGLTFLFSFFLAFAMQFMVIHQWHLYSIFANDPTMSDPNSETGMFLSGFMQKYGTNFRTFKHGALHGTIAGITIALPILGTNALFERKGFKYIMINVGYWTITMALMGGIICAYS